MPYADPNSEAAKASRKKAAKKFYYSHRKEEIEKSAKWAKNNREKVNKNSVIRRSQKMSKEKVLFYNARSRAKVYGIPFEITLEDIIIPEVCPVLGIPLQVNTGCAKDNSFSIDRIIPEKGYVKGNIQIISHKANTIKSNATLEELRKVIEWLSSFPEGSQEV